MRFHFVLLALLSAVVAAPSSSVNLADPQRLLCSVGDPSLIKRQGLNFNKYRGSRWPNGRIPYSVKESDFSTDQLKTILQGISEFNSKTTNVKLVPYRNDTDTNYVNVFSGSGCWSYLGRVGGQQGLSLQQNGCVSSGTVQHEFMHAAGFAHEHDRSDRDNYVTILWENIPDNWKSQYQKVDDKGWRDIGSYDHYSVMHYPIWSPETYKDAFVLPNGVDRNRLGRELTNSDINKLNTLYA